MQADKKIMLLLTLLLLILLLSGCQLPQQPVEVILPPAPDSVKVQQSDSIAKRFEESNPQGPTAVESAIELSEKYAELSKESAQLWQKNQDLIAKNRRLEDRVVSLETKLQQTQRELTEANDLLIEMRIELNNWKSDILGFRGEMRQAEKAQLEALLKILKILGGEVKAE
jgi:chromosome segregation ATPase